MTAWTVPTTWATWNCPPYTESCTPRVLATGGALSVTVALANPAFTFGLEVEPDPFSIVTITATYFNGNTVLGTVSQAVDGYAGALLAAASDTQPITSVQLSSDADFAIAQVRYSSGCQTNVTRLSQGNPQWASDLYDHSSTYTIREIGCALTSLSMALNSAGITTIPHGSPNDPGWLNEFMAATDTDYSGLSVNWGPATRDASSDTMKFHFSNINSINDWQGATQYLNKALCQGGNPVIVGVNLDQQGTPSHFVVVTGKQGNDYTIADPGYSKTTLSQYNNKFVTRGFVADPSGDISELDLTVGDVAEILVIDSSGQETGYDPSLGQIVQQIPNSVYFRDALQDDLTGAPATETIHFGEIFQPSQEAYQIDVNGLKLGTYSLSIRMFSQDGSPQPDVILSGIAGPGSSSSFAIQVNSVPGATTTVVPIATFQSTLADISNSLSLGLIDNPGNANSLFQKIEAAQNDRQPARSNILNAFINEVKALSGKHITGAAVPVLLQDANSLLLP
jgi:Peptidase_C39 like family